MGSSPPPPPQPVTVHGGAGGIVARCDEIAAIGRRFGVVATESLHSTWTLHGYLAHPALLASVAFDPAGHAVFEADLLMALDGLQGLSWAGAESGALDNELRTAAAAYEAADRLATRVHDEILGLLGLPAGLLDGMTTLAATRDPVAAIQATGVSDPGALDVVVDLLGIPAVLAKVAAAIPDGHGVAHDHGLDSDGAAGRPPRSLTDIVRNLAQRDADPHHGVVDVRTITLADGSRRVIVDITGTKSWSLEPSPDITTPVTNGRALTGQRTSYEQGVLDAMRRAGVRKGDDVMLVGHSQGGLVAVNAARDASHTGEFNVTHVVTAGSPVGLTAGQVPAKVKVLALENTRDVVPHLDGRANPDRPNVTTVSSNRGNGTVGGEHDIGDAYVPVANDTQHSHAVSVRDFLTSADGYFRGTHVTTHAYQITRKY